MRPRFELGPWYLRIQCSLFGHRVTRRYTKMDPFTFVVEERGRCKRCTIPLVRSQGQRWKPSNAQEDT